jgi:1-acyl-sn-glycerol-3-phosphate acyltransferase
MIFDPVRHARQNTLDFKPPLPNPVLQKVFHGILPLICNQVLEGLSVEIDEDSLSRLNAIRGERCLILPNHPSEWDPCVIFEVGKRLKENFFFVAAREVFDYSYGLRGWFFQRLGVYSLVRGSNDRKSLKTSMDILSQNKGRLVIFIEGEISNQNETLLSLESGVVQLAFMALQDLYKENAKNIDALPSLYVCPVGLNYQYETEGLDEAIEKALYQLEKAVNIKSATGSFKFERLQQLASEIFDKACAQLGYARNSEDSLADNVAALSGFMLGKLENVLNLPDDSSLNNLDRVRRVRNKMDKVLTQHNDEMMSDYEKCLVAHQRAVLKNCYEDLDRVVNFIAVYDGYLTSEMPLNRYVEMIRRLEREVFGNFKLCHPRKAHVQVREPINLKNHFQAFLADKRSIVQHLSTEIEREISSGIQSSV